MISRAIKYNGEETFHFMAKGTLGGRILYVRFIEVQSIRKYKLDFDTREEEINIINSWEWMPEHDLENW